MSASKRAFSNFRVNRKVIAVKDKYPLPVQKKICNLFSFVSFLCAPAKKGYFTNIHWKALRDTDTDYIATRTILINEGLLQVNWNVSYGKQAKKAHTRSYRITSDKFDTGFFWYSFSGEKKPKTRKDAPIKDATTATGKGVDWQKDFFSRLTVDSENFVSTGDAATDRKIFRAFRKIQAGAFNGSRGRTVGRLYNTITCMPKEGRPYLRYKGRPLTDSDWKTCHPFLILTVCDHREKDSYAAWITNPDVDIYNDIAQWAKSAVSRDALKKELMRFLNGSKHIKNNIFSNYFKLHFPLTWQIIVSSGKSNAKYFQDLEAKIMDELGNYCADNKLSYLQCHDGFLSTETDSRIIANRLCDIVYNHVGYQPIVKSKVICNQPIIKEEDSFSKFSYSNGVAFGNQRNNIIRPIAVLNSNTNHRITHNFDTSNKKRVFEPWLLAKIKKQSQKNCAHVSFLIKDELREGDTDTL